MKRISSFLLAQLLHASNTGFLTMFGAAHISPAQETVSYALYAAVLWVIVALVVARYGKRFVRQPMQVKAM